MRVAIVALGVGAVWMALEVQSVQALWFFTSDLVFVLLFPQLVERAVRFEGQPDRIDRGVHACRWSCASAAASRCSASRR